MSDIRWENLRHIGGLNLDLLDHLEAKQHHEADRQADLRARGIIK